LKAHADSLFLLLLPKTLPILVSIWRKSFFTNTKKEKQVLECRKCFKVKKFECFYRKRDGSGFYPHCKSCHCEHVRNDYWGNPEKRERKKSYQRNISKLNRRKPK